MAHRIDFATAIQLARPSVASLMLLAVLAAITVVGMHRIWQLRMNTERSAVVTSALGPKPSAKAVQKAPDAAQAQAINAAIASLNLPWRELFDAVKSASTPSVALLALEPDAARRTLKVTAEAKALDDMVDFRDRLARHEFFTMVLLLDHERQVQEPQHPVRFAIEVRWREPQWAR
jgi:hypothetical protein